MEEKNPNWKEVAKALIIKHRAKHPMSAIRVKGCPFEGCCAYCGELFPAWAKKYLYTRGGNPVALEHPCHVMAPNDVLVVVNHVLF